MNRSQLLQRLDGAWKAFKESYEGLSDSQMTEPGVTGSWSVKDIIAHVTAWEEESLRLLPVILAGGKTPRYSALYGGIDAFNTQTVENTKNLTLAEVLRQRDDTHRRLVGFLQGVAEDHFIRETRFRRRLRLDTYRHYPEHADGIRKWRARRRTGIGQAQTIRG